ncbi:hypothetical protein GGF31_006678 [Allomyces arbusculus]|nr:hypothetical protein GGF31_006678 [Allomyces arbusculus]
MDLLAPVPRTHLFGADLHPALLDLVHLSEEVLGLGAHAVVLRAVLRRAVPPPSPTQPPTPTSPTTPVRGPAATESNVDLASPEAVAAAALANVPLQRPPRDEFGPGRAVAVKFIFKDEAMALAAHESLGGPGPPAVASRSPSPMFFAAPVPTPAPTPATLTLEPPPNGIPARLRTPTPTPPIAMPVEIRVLSQLSHPNLIRLLAHFEDDAFYYLVMELAGPEVAWSEAEVDHAWNQERPERGYGATPLQSRTSSPCRSQRASICGEVAMMVVSPRRATFEAFLAGQQSLGPVPLFKTSRDLFECLERFGPFCEPRARLVFRQLVDAMAYLHAHNLCHNDIKDENLILSDSLHLKVIDFGSAGPANVPLHGSLGTDAYNSPESLRSNDHACPRDEDPTAPPCKYCFDPVKSEMWALGTVLYVMLNVDLPFDSAQDVLYSPHFRPYRVQVSEKAKLLLSRLLRRDPKLRWGLADVQASAWMKATH